MKLFKTSDMNIVEKDKALIKVLRVEKGWTVDRMMCEFPARQWKRRTLYDLVRRKLTKLVPLIG